MQKPLFVAFAIGALAACVSQPGPETEVGESVYTASVQKLVYDNRHGGLVGPAPAGPPCDGWRAVHETYTLTLADHQLAWEVCEGSGDPATYAPRVGARALGDAEWQGLEPTLAALVVDGGNGCIYDAETRALRVTADDIEVEFVDRDSAACDGQDRPRIVLQAMGDLGTAFDALSRK
ncbi:MAG: hypothetical protein K8W52_35105 [Deltaproteobacteria bacterium]|nr:hypothetical protein [Deltaproteobacteria bacterium]